MVNDSSIPLTVKFESMLYNVVINKHWDELFKNGVNDSFHGHNADRSESRRETLDYLFYEFRNYYFKYVRKQAFELSVLDHVKAEELKNYNFYSNQSQITILRRCIRAELHYLSMMNFLEINTDYNPVVVRIKNE